jgi:polysaccharide pyruvyl transferase WcaK-like protein
VIEPKKKPACIIWGGYAQGNTGDELCLAAALERKQKEFDGNVAILSHRPEITSEIFPGTTVIKYDAKWSRLRRRFIRACKSLTTASGLSYLIRNGRFDHGQEWIRCLEDASQLYLAGGGYLTDLFSTEFFLQPVQLARKMKIPVATAPIGIGPFKSTLHADEAAAALREVKLTVRDQTSLDFCRARGLGATLEPDDAFALVKSLLPPEQANQPGTHPRKIGVSICPQHGQDEDCDLTEWWTECLRGLKAQHPEYKIEGFCFHTSLVGDYQVMRQLFSLAGLPPEQVLAPVADFRRAVEMVHDYDLVISARFHATVTANVFNVPNLAIAAGNYYQTKMSAARLGFESICALINPVSQSPDDLLKMCQGKLDGANRS